MVEWKIAHGFLEGETVWGWSRKWEQEVVGWVAVEFVAPRASWELQCLEDQLPQKWIVVEGYGPWLDV